MIRRPAAASSRPAPIDLFDPRSRLFDATAKSNEDRPSAQFVEPVLEDLVLLASAEAPVPFPVHFTAGVRRSLGIDDNPNGIYNLGDKPVVVAISRARGSNRDDGLYVIVRQALIRSFANGDVARRPADRLPRHGDQRRPARRSA